MQESAEMIAAAKGGVERASAELAKAEQAAAAAGEAQRAGEVKLEVARARRREVDPFSQKAFFAARDEEELAEAQVGRLTALAGEARGQVAGAREAVAAAELVRDRLQLEALREVLAGEDAALEALLRKSTTELAARLAKYQETRSAAERLHHSLHWQRGQQDLPEVRAPWGGAANQARTNDLPALLQEAATVLEARDYAAAPPRERSAVELRMIAADRARDEKFVREALARHTEEAAAAERRRARLGAPDALPLILEPRRKDDEHDYDPVVQ